MPAPTTVLITGAAGFIGQRVLRTLLMRAPAIKIVATDIRPLPAELAAQLQFLSLDVRAAELREVMARLQVQSVIHLAAVVNPPPDMSRALLHAIEVEGTRNLLEACVAAGVGQVIVTSSGAAYGYHADNPLPLTEDCALRGNPEFAYADHKRQAEELLAAYRRRHPRLKQLIFRPGTVLGVGVNNPISALFERRIIVGISGADSPFVIIRDEDVADCIVQGVLKEAEGIYNLAGDGAISLREIAALLRKPYLPLPAGLLGAALALLKPLGLSAYGPEQVRFLRYRPVLANDKLKREFGYTPRKSSRDCFIEYARSRGLLS
ncbi:MAG: NAD-dependent epimerase/dehydratase family protein [Nevskiales bacterium]